MVGSGSQSLSGRRALTHAKAAQTSQTQTPNVDKRGRSWKPGMTFRRTRGVKGFDAADVLREFRRDKAGESHPGIAIARRVWRR